MELGADISEGKITPATFTGEVPSLVIMWQFELDQIDARATKAGLWEGRSVLGEDSILLDDPL
jgi:hypothetical protein